MDQAIDKRKTALSTAIPSTFDEEIGILVYFGGPLPKTFTPIMFTRPRMNAAHAV